MLLWLLPTLQNLRNGFVFSGLQEGHSLNWTEPFTLRVETPFTPHFTPPLPLLFI